jgi:hypothetical protein
MASRRRVPRAPMPLTTENDVRHQSWCHTKHLSVFEAEASVCFASVPGVDSVRVLRAADNCGTNIRVDCGGVKYDLAVTVDELLPRGDNMCGCAQWLTLMKENLEFTLEHRPAASTAGLPDISNLHIS